MLVPRRRNLPPAFNYSLMNAIHVIDFNHKRNLRLFMRIRNAFLRFTQVKEAILGTEYSTKQAFSILIENVTVSFPAQNPLIPR